MNAVQDTSNVSSLFGASASGAAKSGTEATQDRFLTLLVAQMKNQDPMHPLDNAEITSQLAQLSTVQGIENMNSTLQALAASLGSNQIGQAANLIGRGVLVPGDSIGPTQPSDVLGFELARPADAVKLSIQDAAGNTVRTLDLGPRQSGINVLAWDGLNDAGSAVPDGNYRFKIEATQGGKAVDVTMLNLGMVNSVSQSSDGVQLNLSNNAQASYADIRQIF
jgi:flagellar basal-body rod modification protein FlgD